MSKAHIPPAIAIRGMLKQFSRSFSVPQYTWPLSKCIKKLKILALIEAEKFVTENLLGEKEKWINKGNDKQQHADSLLNNTTSHYQH